LSLINCIKKSGYSTRDKLNVAYGWLEEEAKGSGKSYTSTEVLELVSTFLRKEDTQ
jgi:hypothetical protein